MANAIGGELSSPRINRRNTKHHRKFILEMFLYAMKEDLAEWLSSLMNVEISSISFMDEVDNGVLLCEHANLVQRFAEEYNAKLPEDEKIKIPKSGVRYKLKGAISGSFVARDNVANFLAWCRELGIPDVVLFESDDLVMHKNEKTVVLTLLDVARKAAKVGVRPPQIVKFEEEIDREIEEDKKREKEHKEEKILELEEDNDLDTMVSIC